MASLNCAMALCLISSMVLWTAAATASLAAGVSALDSLNPASCRTGTPSLLTNTNSTSRQRSFGPRLGSPLVGVPPGAFGLTVFSAITPLNCACPFSLPTRRLVGLDGSSFGCRFLRFARPFLHQPLLKSHAAIKLRLHDPHETRVTRCRNAHGREVICRLSQLLNGKQLRLLCQLQFPIALAAR